MEVIIPVLSFLWYFSYVPLNAFYGRHKSVQNDILTTHILTFIAISQCTPPLFISKLSANDRIPKK